MHSSFVVSTILFCYPDPHWKNKVGQLSNSQNYKHRKTAISGGFSRFLAKGYNFDRKPHPWGATAKIVGCISPGGGVHFLFWGAFWGAFPRGDAPHLSQKRWRRRGLVQVWNGDLSRSAASRERGLLWSWKASMSRFLWKLYYAAARKGDAPVPR